MLASSSHQHPSLVAPGVMLTPNLRLLRLLGRGGMGSVWLAEHLVLGSAVAVKLLSSELIHDPEALERFRREATAVAQLKSPHVVAIHDFGATADGIPYFVMENLDGEDLHHRLERVGKLPIGIVTAIIAQTCKALARAHELGIVHRDLKPGNIFLTTVDGDLVVKLLDFGVAKVWSNGGAPAPSPSTPRLHHTSDQAVLGTPMYMSPEQVLSPRKVGPRSDLYSLAVVAYECLVGQRPFEGETVGALHVAIANGRYTPICGVDPTLPLALDGWFARAFATEQNDRFATAREMSDAFMEAARVSFSLDHLPVAKSDPLLFAAADAAHASGSWPLHHGPSLAPAPLHTPPPNASPSPFAAVLPFIAGALAVLVLVAGILGAAHLTRRASASASASAPNTGTARAVEPASAAAAPATTPTGMIIVTAEPPSAAPSSTAETDTEPDTSAKPAGTVPLPVSKSSPPPPSKPRRKNRGF